MWYEKKGERMDIMEKKEEKKDEKKEKHEEKDIKSLPEAKMKKGDYRIHIYFEQSRSLVLPAGEEVIEPVFVVSAYNITKSTRPFPSVSGSTVFVLGEHLFIDVINKLPEEVKNGRVVIEVRDHNKMLKDQAIGSFEFDVGFVYNSQDHAVLHKWVVLSSPSDENFFQPKGYIKLGISVTHEEDLGVDLCQPEKGKADDAAILPTFIKPKLEQVVIQVIKAESLPIMDKGGTADIYCSATVSGYECRTSVIEADNVNFSVMWCEELFLPCLVPCVSNSLRLNFMDYDTVGADDFIGSVDLDLEKIKKGKYKDFFWSNIYGAPPLADSEAADLMNKIPELASHWRGRVLLKVWVIDDCKTILKKSRKIRHGVSGYEEELKEEEKKTKETEEEKEKQKEKEKAKDKKKGKGFGGMISGIFGSDSGTESEEENEKKKKKSKEKVLDKEKKENKFMNEIIEKFETGQAYEIRAQVFNASALPYKEGKYKVKIEWSGVELATSEKETENGDINWFETCKRKVAQIPKGVNKLLPDVFIYLIYDDEKVCFIRLKAKDCFEKDKIASWKHLRPETHVGKVKNLWNAGFLRLKIYIGLYDESNPDANWGPLKPPAFNNWVLYAHIFQCRDLPAADKNGLADPYFVLYCCGNEASTKSSPCDLTLNPKWYKTFSMPISITSPEEAPPMMISLFDYDTFDEDDFMGMCQIDLTQAEIDPEIAPKPKWRKLSLGDNYTECGEILCSFTLSTDVEYRRRFNITPKFVETTVDINVLGLRDLKPAVGWLPVNKAFVRFDLNSLEIPGAAVSAEPVETQPFEEGPDPNILTVVSAKCKMPVDPLYASSFTVTVHDSLFGGISQPLIGTFTINLSRYFYPRTKLLQFAEALAKQRNIIKFRRLIRKIFKTDLFSFKKHDEAPRAKPDSLSFVEICQEANRLVVIPNFEVGKKDVIKEANIPDPRIYMPIGYNRQADDGKKHYRYKLDDVLEHTHVFSYLPFDEFPIYRATYVENSGNEAVERPSLQQVGVFKANIRVAGTQSSQRNADFDAITKQLLIKKKCVVRVYILDAFDIEQKDADSLSDPYVRVKLGDIVFSDKNNHQEDVTDPKIYKVFDIYTTLPGRSILKVQMWDYNKFSSDTKIGTTRIDLENRFFNKDWHNLAHKPIETRPLYLPSCKRPQGFVRMWVEIMEEGKVTPAIDISLKPHMDIEARLIIWKSADVQTGDPRDPGDLYVKAKINDSKEQRTDTHYKAVGGEAAWNWRMKFNVIMPCKIENIVTLQIWDKDFLSGNDFLSEAKISIQSQVNEVYNENSIVKVAGPAGRVINDSLANEWKAFWVECKNKAGAPGGQLLVSLELVPERIAKNIPVGEGRDEPNHSPVLVKPSGRFKWSMNPIRLLGELVGPELNTKVCCFIILGILILLLIICVPIFFATGASSVAFS